MCKKISQALNIIGVECKEGMIKQKYNAYQRITKTKWKDITNNRVMNGKGLDGTKSLQIIGGMIAILGSLTEFKIFFRFVRAVVRYSSSYVIFHFIFNIVYQPCPVTTIFNYDS